MPGTRHVLHFKPGKGLRKKLATCFSNATTSSHHLLL